MSTSELMDLYDENRNPLNRTYIRGGKRNPGEYHTFVETITVNSAGNILVTLRDNRKKLNPGKWEITGGAVRAGESSRQAAVRELHEETGMDAMEDEFVFIGSIRGAGFWGDIYILHRDISIADLTLQDGETTAAKWVNLFLIPKMITAGEMGLPFWKRDEICTEKVIEYISCAVTER